MWPFTKKRSIADSGILNDFTDYHSHILPGVDDGVQTMAESLEILYKYEKLGIKKVWLTPHIMDDYPNTTTHLRERFAELQAAYHGSVELYLASENMLDNLFEKRLDANDILPIGKNGNHLLVETSCFNPPMDLYGILERIKAKGYHPILAHPERYAYMNKEDYKRLKRTGVKFQMNLFSLAGLYGAEVKKQAEWLLKANCYNLVGSDIHSLVILEGNIIKKLSGNVPQMPQGIISAYILQS